MEATRILDSLASLKLLDSIFTRVVTDPNSTNLPLLVAIDTEPGSRSLAELGISTFDPCCLRLPANDDLKWLNDSITTYCYAKAGSKNRKRYKPYRLGTVQRFQNADLREIFNTHLQSQTDAEGTIRKVVLIGHSIGVDISFLKQLVGLDISRLSNIEAVLDTQDLSKEMLQKNDFMSLKRLLNEFGLDYIGLHNAGHDSRYTLRSLLMLFVRFKHSENLVQSEQMIEVMATMERIARCHVTNKRITWTTSSRVKLVSVPGLFDQDGDEDDVTGMLGLLD